MKRQLLIVCNACLLAGVAAVLYANGQEQSEAITSVTPQEARAHQPAVESAARSIDNSSKRELNKFVKPDASAFYRGFTPTGPVVGATVTSRQQVALKDYLPPGLLELEQQDKIPDEPEQALRQRVLTVARTYREYGRVDEQPAWMSFG